MRTRCRNVNAIPDDSKKSAPNKRTRDHQPLVPQTITNDDSDEDYSDPELECSESDDEYQMPSIDIKNLSKPLMVSRYAEQIILNSQNEETKFIVPSHLFAETQDEISDRMRAKVVKWLISVSQDFMMGSETLFNAIHFLDVCLSKCRYEKTSLQLLGAVCLWMSGKLNEIRNRPVSDFIELCNDPYQMEDFINMEEDVFRLLDYRLYFPTPKVFIRRYLDAIEANKFIVEAASFVCECSLMSLEINDYRPSIIAVCSVIIASIGLKDVPPLTKLKRFAHLDSFEEIKPCCLVLFESVNSVLTSRQGPIYQRYTDIKLSGAVSKMKFDVDNFMKNIDSLQTI